MLRAQCLKVVKGQKQWRVVPRMKCDAKLAAVTLKLVPGNATSRVSDNLFVPRAILVHQELLANHI